jgi:hypothetical protein
MNDQLTQKSDPARIMVVDDIPANLKLLTEIITGYGYQVRPVFPLLQVDPFLLRPRVRIPFGGF